MHVICAEVTEAFLTHQISIGNDLSTPRPQFGFAGLKPGGICITAGLRQCQVVRSLGEIPAGGGLDADHIRPERRAVEIERKDFPFG